MDEYKKLKKIAKGVAIGGAVVTGVALAPVAIGFGSAGIVAGSIAAGIQSLIGNVTAGGIFATMTSLGMTGAFTTTAAVGGTAAAAGSSTPFIKKLFGHNPQKDAKKIFEMIHNRENPEKLVKLIEYRKPVEREMIRIVFDNNYVEDRNFDQEIINYMPQNLHIVNLLRQTDAILPLTPQIGIYLMNQPLSEYFKKKFSHVLDANLINDIILSNDNPLIIIRLIEYRSDKERVKIDNEFRRIRGDPNKRMLFYILDYIGNNHPDVSYLHALLEDTE